MGILSGTREEIQDQLESLGWKHADKLKLPKPEGITPVASDKFSQGYMPAYYQIASELGTSARVCEIGVWHGASLVLWQNLFPDGVVAGVDADEDQAFWPEGTQKIVSYQNDSRLPDKLRILSYSWDLIVDDASHEGTLTAETFNNLWPLVRPGGYYVIEDWFVGWWKGQQHIYGMVDLAKDLLDFLTGKYDIDEIRYRPGMIIIRKFAPSRNLPEISAQLKEMHENPLRVGDAESGNTRVFA